MTVARPDVRERERAYQREYRSRPGMRAIRARKQREYVEKNREEVKRRLREYNSRPEVKAARKEYNKTRRIERLLAEAKKRARKKGLTFTISVSDVVIPLICPAIGIPIIWDGPRHNWPSIDRFDNSKGYTPENIRVISWRANNLKGDATAEEAKRIAIYMGGL